MPVPKSLPSFLEETAVRVSSPPSLFADPFRVSPSLPAAPFLPGLGRRGDFPLHIPNLLRRTPVLFFPRSPASNPSSNLSWSVSSPEHPPPPPHISDPPSLPIPYPYSPNRKVKSLVIQRLAPFASRRTCP